MKCAIYFLAVGDRAWECLLFSYKSIETAGFVGDVYILSDRDSAPFPLSRQTKLLKIKDKDLNLDKDSASPMALFDVRRIDQSNPRNVRSPEKWTICRAKTLIDRYISFDKYDYVLYLDVDVLTQGPLDVLADFLANNNGLIITAQNQFRQRLGGRRNFSFRKLRRVLTYSAANLTNFELTRYWFTPAICSDIVCIPTDANGKRLMRAWREECQKNIDFDQPALQAVLLREFRRIHMFAPHRLFGYGPKHDHYLKNRVLKKAVGIFVHFGGAIKDTSALRDYYARYIERNVNL